MTVSSNRDDLRRNLFRAVEEFAREAEELQAEFESASTDEQRLRIALRIAPLCFRHSAIARALASVN